MESIQRFLYPNPGWELSESSQIDEGDVDTSGRHCILELYDCDKSKLNDEAGIRTVLTLAAKLSGAKLLNLITHKFEPQGVTGLALLAESHISIHTWPENSYAAVDVFTCGDHAMPEKACEFLCKELRSQRSSLNNLQRKTPIGLGNACRQVR